MASGSADKTIRIWNVATGVTQATLTGHSGSVSSVDWLPGDKTIVSCAPNERAIYHWEIKSGLVLERYVNPGVCGSNYGICVLSDGRTAISGALKKGEIKIWDLQTKEVEKKLTAHVDTVYSLCWSKDERTLVSVSKDKTARIWDRATGTCNRVLSGHTDVVIAASQHQIDGLPVVATKSRDGTVRIWNTDTGDQLTCLEEPVGDFWINGIAFHPTAPLLATLGEKDQIIRRAPRWQ